MTLAKTSWCGCGQVWGSWWSGGQWGYACCHQGVKNSYCTGAAGETAAEEAAAQMQANLDARARDTAEARAREAADPAAASTSSALVRFHRQTAGDTASSAICGRSRDGSCLHWGLCVHLPCLLHSGQMTCSVQAQNAVLHVPGVGCMHGASAAAEAWLPAPAS